MRVLVAEDDTRIAGPLTAALRAAGFVVETAGDGEDVCRRRPPLRAWGGEAQTEVKDRSPELAKQYIELVSALLSDPETSLDFPKKTLKEFEDLVFAESSALGAQAIGWRYIEEDKSKRAGEWFDRSVEWEATEGGVIGQAVVASRLKHYKTLKSIKAQFGDDYAELEDFTVYTKQMKKSRSASAKAGSRVKVTCNRKDLFTLFACARR